MSLDEHMTKAKQLTGYHIAAMMIGAFGVIIAANLVLAWFAIGTFPGLDAKNSYVASQHFNQKESAQLSLGWHVFLKSLPDGDLTLDIQDSETAPLNPASLTLRIGKSTNAASDRLYTPHFKEGLYHADTNLSAGNWVVYIKAQSQTGAVFEQRHQVIMR